MIEVIKYVKFVCSLCGHIWYTNNSRVIMPEYCPACRDGQVAGTKYIGTYGLKKEIEAIKDKMANGKSIYQKDVLSLNLAIGSAVLEIAEKHEGVKTTEDTTGQI